MRRFALVVFVLSVAFAVAALCAPAHATNYKHMYDWVSNRYGQAVSGATVYVYAAGTTTPATIYTDIAGGTSAGTSLTTDADGYWECYIDPATRVDVRMYKLAVALDTTISDWTYPGSVSSHAVARADTFSAVTGDTLKFRASDGQDDAYLHSKSALIPNFYTPAAHSMWFKKRGAGTGYYIMALGGTGNAPAVQFHQNTTVNWVFSDGEDHAVMGVDTTATAAAEDALEFYNYRGDDKKWNGGAGPAGSPTYAIRFYSDIEDSTTIPKETFRIRETGGFNNNESMYLSMFEDNTNVYQFQKQGLVMYRASAADSTKFIQINGGSQYTKFGDIRGVYTYMRSNNGVFNVLDDDGSDDAFLQVANWRLGTVVYKGNLPTASACVGCLYNDASADTVWYSTGSTWGQIYP